MIAVPAFRFHPGAWSFRRPESSTPGALEQRRAGTGASQARLALTLQLGLYG
jgi:hypothetical protein